MKILRYVLFAFSVLLSVSTVRAQQTVVKLNIPFEFTAGDRTYPAGEYSFKSGFSNELLIRMDSREVPPRNLLSNVCRNADPAPETKAVFHRVGDSYFLYQVWVAGSYAGHQFPKTREEVRLAQNHDASEVVVLAANMAK